MSRWLLVTENGQEQLGRSLSNNMGTPSPNKIKWLKSNLSEREVDSEINY